MPPSSLSSHRQNFKRAGQGKGAQREGKGREDAVAAVTYGISYVCGHGAHSGHGEQPQSPMHGLSGGKSPRALELEVDQHKVA